MQHAFYMLLGDALVPLPSVLPPSFLFIPWPIFTFPTHLLPTPLPCHLGATITQTTFILPFALPAATSPALCLCLRYWP